MRTSCLCSGGKGELSFGAPGVCRSDSVQMVSQESTRASALSNKLVDARGDTVKLALGVDWLIDLFLRLILL